MQQSNTSLPKPNFCPSAKGNIHARRFTKEERQRALVLLATGVSAAETARLLGATDKTIRVWARAARANGTFPESPVGVGKAEERTPTEEPSPKTKFAASTPNEGESAPAVSDARSNGGAARAPTEQGGTRSVCAPKAPGQGLADYEKEAILELKKKHPSYGPAQLRAQLRRFNGWRLNIKAIAKVLRDNGYQLVHRGSRPKGPEPTRFEAPRRNALWQIDFAEMRIVGEKLQLCVLVDDYSRYAVGHALAEHQSAEVAIDVVQKAIAKHGKPEALRSDRGGAFLGGEFSSFLESELIDHIVGHSYHPQGGGKVESLIGTVRRELWDVEHFEEREHALRRTREFFDSYNERRAHMGIDGLTPADRYFGRCERVLAAINALSRKRNAALPISGSSIEELVATGLQNPTEVLRLVLVNGKMELRFCGARVELGNIEGA